jgi:hypothetical protein
MTIRVHHLWDSPQSKLTYSGEGEDDGTWEYMLTNCPTSPQAYLTLLGGNGVDWAGLPGEIDGLLCRDIRMTPDGPNAWHAVVQYGEPKLITREKEKLKEIGDYRVAFSVKPTTFKHFVAKSTKIYGTTPPNFGGTAIGATGLFAGVAINVTEDGEVQGVDAILPALTITVTQRMQGATLTPAFANTVSGLVGKYNNATFMGHFPAGTIQFTGGDGALSYTIPNPIAGGTIAPQDRELSFEFLYSPNLTNISVGPITGIDKLGHQYMWVLWKSELEGSQVTKQPRAVYVQDIHGIEPASFTPLGLGV